MVYSFSYIPSPHALDAVALAFGVGVEGREGEGEGESLRGSRKTQLNPTFLEFEFEFEFRKDNCTPPSNSNLERQLRSRSFERFVSNEYSLNREARTTKPAKKEELSALAVGG